MQLLSLTTVGFFLSKMLEKDVLCSVPRSINTGTGLGFPVHPDLDSVHQQGQPDTSLSLEILAFGQRKPEQPC